MSHSHTHETTHGLQVAFFLNVGFALLEIAGGLWTNSVAVLSDAIHDLGDSLALGAAWRFDRYAQRTGDERFSYGYRRFSLLGAWTSTTVLITGSAIVMLEAVPRLFDPKPAYAPGMLAFALLGIGVNGAAAWRLRGQQSLNTRVAAWHLIEDLLGWVAVLVGSVVMLLADLPVVDPLLSIAITAFVLFNVARHIRKTMLLFLQAVPDDIDLTRLEQRLAALSHVQSTHHTHVWSMDGRHHVLTAHIVVDGSATRSDLDCLRADIAALCAEYRFAHTTIEIEWGNDACRMDQPIAGTAP